MEANKKEWRKGRGGEYLISREKRRKFADEYMEGKTEEIISKT